MNVEGSQWASLSANVIEQAQALVERIPEQMDNYIASVPPALRNDSAAIAGSTASLSFLAPCAIEYSDFPLCANISAVRMNTPPSHTHTHIPADDTPKEMKILLVSDHHPCGVACQCQVPDLPCLVHATDGLKPGSKTPANFSFGSNYFGGLPWVCHSMYLAYRKRPTA